MAPREHEIPILWRHTGLRRFLFAAKLEGTWWVLRINGFPDHPLWTLFVGGKPRLDLDGTPPAWELKEAPDLDEATAREAVADVEAFAVYGSEVGRPCDDPVCCDV